MNDEALERWAAVRLAYETGKVSVAAICREFGLTKWDLYAVAHRQGWVLRNGPGKHSLGKHGPGRHAKTGTADRRTLITQLYDSLARQMRESEQDMSEATSETARERQARILSNLTRTLEKLVELEKGVDAAEQGKKQKARARRAAEQLREELAQKLLRLSGRGGAAEPAQGLERKGF